ncbi:glucokinase [Thiocystis violascens]|uniref:Glucokinase n=1 Tax=Thiocystis violascens (strain ATCC 17096 / DSM 198 / 6111) TaxID=765911 RepID=I3YHA5_THIV6|nr:glucokinase [Thiocystis violascens]AFL76373.1 glucokinase [Thiocystis violascens DSM 198]
MRLLVGDIGGTKTALGVAQTDGETVTLTEPRRYPSAAFESLDQIVRRYCGETGLICRFAAFAVAGPIQDRRCETTNLPWILDADELEHSFGFAGVDLLNDLEAVAWGVDALGPQDLAVIHPGDGIGTGNACVVAAGTGLGQAGLYWDGVRHHAFATEGGHTDFAPADDLEFALLTHLKARFGRVSWERVVSGMGIANLYEFLLVHRGAEPPAWLRQAIAEGGDTAAAVAQAAADDRCPLCVETMGLFMRLYGREAGNLALKQMALGGVFLGGGIALKNLSALRNGQFLEGFFDKGRMEPLMRRMPVCVILQPHTPLLGAARFMASQ